jgi:hypothetical protein
MNTRDSPNSVLQSMRKCVTCSLSLRMVEADEFSVFIAEITARAFIIADSNKRRTLSRSDIAQALSKSDQFDFLIDIVPREEPISRAGGSGMRKPTNDAEGLKGDQVRLVS